MKLDKWLEHARLLVRVVEKDACVPVEIKYADLVQELAWFEELQAYRDTGLTPEQVNLTEATLWKEQGLIARESDRERGRWGLVHGDFDDYYQCSECHYDVTTVSNYCPECGAKMGVENETD